MPDNQLPIDVVVLAAGKGTRMYSDIPKVLHPIGGRPMAQHVVDAALLLGDVQLHVVVGHEATLVQQALEGVASFVEQSEQLGTGHAVAQALPALREGALTLVLYGDVPLITTATLEKMVQACSTAQMSLLTVSLDDPQGYGRICRDSAGNVTAIVEQKDANSEQLGICEVNTGIMCMTQQQLAKWLPALGNNNAQGEYYLTDVVEMAVSDGVGVTAINASSVEEVEGVNNKLQLATLERCYQRQCAEALMLAGTTLADPSRIDIRGSLQVGRDVYIDVNAVFTGDVVLGDNVSIGANCVVHESEIGANTQLLSHCSLDRAKLASDCVIGPYARLRPGTELGSKAKIGNFVEVKNSSFGEGSKANHLAYVGDSEVGSGCNIGAGTITCNYDGAYKHKTRMGDNVFIGSNSTLVAPIDIEDNGFVAAGSTINQQVPKGNLAVGRAKQKNISGWKRPKKD
ncbi:MAG: bifunctional UDP-N-acetylglucosamine diphosphorylase/glucosamine-1-phosphate N-acetyltransferase GlmU [Gammaproteobacteria bacterium]|nr:bifunctional UDP-N-acetylglucosamine diphosphorylase/glucosamine-1-phosphate N-acetyltransferase GlmU [Gammaproteobacteria bacterium]